MDPVSAAAIAGAITTAAANSAGGEAGRTAWESLVALWRRRITPDADTDSGPPDAQDAAAVGDFARAVVEAGGRDAGFAAQLAVWAREQGVSVRVDHGSVTNTVAADARVERLVQGRDFSGPITFNG